MEIFVINFIVGSSLFLISLFVLIIYEQDIIRKKAKIGMLISLVLFIVGLSSCLTSI